LLYFGASPDPSSARTNAKTRINRGFAKSISPENSFRKTESELKPRHTARILGRQNPKKKNVLSILEKIHPRENKKSKEHFFFLVLPSEASGGGAESVRFSFASPRAPRVAHLF